jgi:ABC-type multidrug transport system fused ATPase/permease subunit
MAKMLFTYMGDPAKIREDSDFWCLWMLIAAIIAFITGFTQKFGFGVVGENVTMNVRHALYQAIVKKDIGWFDRRDNAPGILTSTLASEAQALNGASTEGTAVILESTVAVICGVTLGFIFTWRLALVALACVPFMMFGGMINSRLHAGMSSFDDKAYKDANLLAGDAILNFRTVAGLSADKSIVKTYDAYIDIPTRAAIRKS